jgi:hypothetical protein
MPNTQPKEPVALANEDDKRNRGAVTVGNAKAKNARLRLLKERNENYLAEQRDENADEELTEELRVAGSAS